VAQVEGKAIESGALTVIVGIVDNRETDIKAGRGRQ
jgi:hypothetical protein